MIRSVYLGTLIVAMCMTAGSAADTTAARIDRLEQRVFSVINKAGIHFGGAFKSQFLLSRADSAAPAVAHEAKRDESVEYTSVDFDIAARPNDAVSGRVIFRMHQDWRNFFSDITNPIFTRWISADGRVKNMFGYNVGDFRRRYSPLTLWSPDVEIEYEPEIFARLRREVQHEVFLGNNDRILQGVNFDFDAEIAPLLKELHFNLLGSRLRLAEASIQNGSAVAAAVETAPMDRYVVGTNVDMVVLRGLSAGASFLDVFDAKPTWSGSDVTRDTLAQQTAVWAARAEAGTPLFINADRFSATLRAEAAQSLDDTAWYRLDSIDTDNDGAADSLRSRILEHDRITGLAAAIDIDARIKIGAASHLQLGAAYMYNENDFRNAMAQSPTFLPQRIMNIENDGNSGALYSTYDALYRHVFKFTPSPQLANKTGWFKAPMRKISYTNAILTREETAAAVRFDPALQLVLPMGPATPNRSGVRASAAAGLLDNAVRMSASALSLKELSGEQVYAARRSGDSIVFDTVLSTMPTTAYVQAGGGFSVDIGAMSKALGRPLRLSAGYTLSTASNSGIADRPLTAFAVSSGFLNAGVYFNVWKRASMLAGLQRIETKSEGRTGASSVTMVQTQWSGGVEYKVTEGGTLTASVGRINAAFDDDDPATTGDTDAGRRNFAQWQTELFLTVAF